MFSFRSNYLRNEEETGRVGPPADNSENDVNGTIQFLVSTKFLHTNFDILSCNEPRRPSALRIGMERWLQPRPYVYIMQSNVFVITGENYQHKKECSHANLGHFSSSSIHGRPLVPFVHVAAGRSHIKLIYGNWNTVFFFSSFSFLRVIIVFCYKSYLTNMCHRNVCDVRACVHRTDRLRLRILSTNDKQQGRPTGR